jgi:hypothetical protein
LNHAVFYGKLPRVAAITLIKHRREHAWAIPARAGAIKLTIQPRFESRRLFLMVLVHEMVHAWDHFHHSHMTHGEQFFKWQKRIMRTTNLELKECPDEHNPDPD